MIYTFIPYCPKEVGKNLGYAYNRCMASIGQDDWACFLDHDAMFTTNEWYSQLETIIAMPDVKIGVLTCVTNRIGNSEQRTFPKDSPEALNHDIYFHRKIGKDMLFANGTQIRVARKPISGVMLLTNAKVWARVGGFEDGFLGIDNDYDKKAREAGYTTYIADGIYVYHWYRAAPDQDVLPAGYNKGSFLPPV